MNQITVADLDQAMAIGSLLFGGLTETPADCLLAIGRLREAQIFLEGRYARLIVAHKEAADKEAAAQVQAVRKKAAAPPPAGERAKRGRPRGSTNGATPPPATAPELFTPPQPEPQPEA